LAQSNRQDFLNLGHVFSNLGFFINIPAESIKQYKEVLIRSFLKDGKDKKSTEDQSSG
jgi:hypothetical protein